MFVNYSERWSLLPKHCFVLSDCYYLPKFELSCDWTEVSNITDLTNRHARNRKPYLDPMAMIDVEINLSPDRELRSPASLTCLSPEKDSHHPLSYPRAGVPGHLPNSLVRSMDVLALHVQPIASSVRVHSHSTYPKQLQPHRQSCASLVGMKM